MKFGALLCSAAIATSCGARPSTTSTATSTTTSTAKQAPHTASSPQEPHPCDPIETRKPAPAPTVTGPVCGNGVIDVLAGTCVEVCTGGCEEPITCRIECTNDREHCDGDKVEASCASEGYAGGRMACSSDCELDDSACTACVAGTDVRCGTTGLAGDEVHVVSSASRAAVFARKADTGQIIGAKVDAALRTTPLTGLPGKTLAAAALDGRLGVVDARRRFGTIDIATGRARVLGPIGGDSPEILIARETFQAGGAAVLTGDYQRRTLAIFDGPAPVARDQPRHFYLSNVRIVVVPGAHELARGVTTGGADLVVLAFGNEIFAYQRDGLELTRLPKVPPGIELAFTYPSYTDTIRWSSGQLATTRRVAADVAAPAPGLSRAALSGAQMTTAFGGVLMANRRASGGRARTELYWQAGADPLAPSRSTQSSP